MADRTSWGKFELLVDFSASGKIFIHDKIEKFFCWVIFFSDYKESFSSEIKFSPLAESKNSLAMEFPTLGPGVTGQEISVRVL